MTKTEANKRYFMLLTRLHHPDHTLMWAGQDRWIEIYYPEEFNKWKK